ncbi:MAG: diaminopimelate decarboxylase [Clostridia bacterium]|nr:diaminopimelate decarboxylase [Clostridia bacterium]
MPNFALSDDVFIRAAEQFPTPFHLYDEAGIRKTARSLNAAFAWAPDYKEYFAVKALPNPAILKIFKEEGCGLDCSSECELLLAEMCGFQGDEIMFSANAMPPAEYDHARRLNAIVNLDDISDIDTLSAHGGIPETVCVRYNPGGDFTLGNAIMGSPGESKYGWTKEQLVQGLSRLKALGAKRFGLHAFLSSNTIDNSYYPKLAGILFALGAEMSEKCGLGLAFVNLSGGIGIPYRPGVPAVDIAAVGAGVEKEYVRIFGSPASAGVKIKTELGRYMTGPYGWLVTHAVHEKNIYRHYIGVDACAANLMRPAIYGAYHHIHVCGKRDAPADHVYDVTGCLCENNDKFAIERPLPEIKKGDLLVIHDTGAHGFSMGYQYNGRLRSAEILYTRDGQFRMIRRAETPKDYFATLVSSDA